MGFFDFFFQKVQQERQGIKKNSAFKKGEKFEKYTRDFIFPKDFYTIVEKTHNYKTNKDDYVESSLKPDFKFRHIKTKKEFYVECKFRSTLFKDKIEWCTLQQLKRYQELAEDCEVLILIGFGGRPSDPERLFLLPLDAARYTGLYLSHAQRFEIPLDVIDFR